MLGVFGFGVAGTVALWRQNQRANELRAERLQVRDDTVQTDFNPNRHRRKMGDSQTRSGRIHWMSRESMLVDVQQVTGLGCRRGSFQALLHPP